jgi:hypothetical protein
MTLDWQRLWMMGMGERRSPIRQSRGAARSRTTPWPSVGTLALALGLVLLPPARPAEADVYVGFQSSQIAFALGDTFSVYVMIPQADAAFNAFDASIRFDPTMVSFDPITPLSDQRGSLMTSACGNTFHRFETASDSLKTTLSLLCSNTSVIGPGMIYHVRFRAGSVPGATTISLGPFTEFYNAGLFVRPQHKTDMIVNIGAPTGMGDEPTGGEKLEFAPPAPNPGHGGGSMVLGFSLPGRDRVSFDLMDAQGRRVARMEAGWYEAGSHRVLWSPPTLANGDYFIRLRARSSGSAVRRWAVLR